MSFCVEVAGESSQFSRETDHSMARHDDSNRIPADCGPDCACGFWVAKLLRKLAVSPRLPEWDAKQCLPHLLLEVCPSHIEWHRKSVSPGGKIFVQFRFGAKQHWVGSILHQIVKQYAPRSIIFPKNSH